MSIDRILRWFPSAWRSRYEAEVRDLLDAHPFGWRERLDLMRACADAWLREGASWGTALLRGVTYVGVRLAVLVAIGWLGVRGAEALVPGVMGAEWQPPDWVNMIAPFVRTFAWGYAGIFVLRPYIENLENRPGRIEAVAFLTVFAVALAFDGRPAHLGDVLWFGLIATMRHSWFHLGTSAGTLAAPRSILGLR